MSKPKILFQLDTSQVASSFDSVVAIDAGVEHLITHACVNEDNIEGLVHGAIFTRGPDDLKNTALFFGGDDVAQAESVVQRATECFFGPLRVSLMADPNGSNTTAAAAVICAEKHLDSGFEKKTVTVLGGTGPVGQRISGLIADESFNSGAGVSAIRIGALTLAAGKQICDTLRKSTGHDVFEAFQTDTAEGALVAIRDSDVVFASGTAGVQLLPEKWLELTSGPGVAIDLNAVPPAGIAGIKVTDSGQRRGAAICYGAIGVGGLKMKIHRRCLRRLFESNEHVLRVAEIYRLGKEIETD